MRSLSDYWGGGTDRYCKFCRGKLSRAWQKANPERVRELGRKNQSERYTRIRMELIDAYGGRCTCCGEPDPHFLTIEHCNGVPDEHKRKGGKRKPNLTIMVMIRDAGYPDDYTILCWNCNGARAYYGFCPHQPGTEEMRRYPSRSQSFRV